MTMKPSGSNPGGGFGGWMLGIFRPGSTANLAVRARRRIWLHLIPYLFFLYILAYLDRVNVSVAGLGMQLAPRAGGLGFGRDVIGLGFGIFFWGYWILEIPSTVSVVRWGARWVFVRILILWGICAALVGAIGTPLAGHLFGWLPHVAEHAALAGSIDGALNHLFGPTAWAGQLIHSTRPVQVMAGAARFINRLHDTPAYQFYFLRFMLGFFEGGFFPSVIVYLAQWFRTEDRAKAIASFMAAIPLASMIGMPVSGWLLGVHWFGLPGWRWIFILEGIVPVLTGVATLFFLPDRPARAAWLPADERDWLVAELDREQRAKQGLSAGAWLHHLGMVVLLTAVYFCLNVTSYGLASFMPAIIKSQSGASSRVASALAALPYVMALIAMFINGWHSDRTGERAWHVAVPLILWSVGIWIAVVFDGWPVVPVIAMIVFVGTFMYAHLPAFWPIPTMWMGATAAASAIGFINMIGNLGGSVGAIMVGNAAVGRTSFAPALLKLAPWPLVAAAIVLVIGYTRKMPRAPVPVRPVEPGVAAVPAPAAAIEHPIGP